MRVAVGCPVRNRAWILPDYIEHVRAAFFLAGLEPYWVFNIGSGPNGMDDGTRHIVTDLYKEGQGVWTESTEPDIPKERAWNYERYEQMAAYRNQLLSLVRYSKADYFLSLDSDILIHPSALVCLLDTIQNSRPQSAESYGAVGGKAYLSERSADITTFGEIHASGSGSGIRRRDSDGVFQTQILMAIKLMSPAAYNIDYTAHALGEDIGWSLACAKAGVVLGWDGRVCSKHIMKQYNDRGESLIELVDQRVGW